MVFWIEQELRILSSMARRWRYLCLGQKERSLRVGIASMPCCPWTTGSPTAHHVQLKTFGFGFWSASPRRRLDYHVDASWGACGLEPLLSPNPPGNSRVRPSGELQSSTRNNHKEIESTANFKARKWTADLNWKLQKAIKAHFCLTNILYKTVKLLKHSMRHSL